MASLLAIAIALGVAYVTWNIQSLLSNYLKVRQSGFPIHVCPANTSNLVWMIFSVVLRPIFVRLLPRSAFNSIRSAIYGFEFLDKYEPFTHAGSSFIQVTPGKNELWTADPEVAHAILARRNDFIQFDVASRIMGMFGPNVISTDGDDWQRQRRIIAPLINERISKSVWEESCDQAQTMLKNFTAKPASKSEAGSGTKSTVEGLRWIAINVLGAVGYGTQQTWGDQSTEAPPGYRLSYMSAILAVVENLVPSTFVPSAILASPVMPDSIRRIGFAVNEFPLHVKDLLDTERKSKRSAQTNILSTLVTASDVESKANSKLFLTEYELAGNLFQFTVAGFDTTANTMAYAITLLAIRQDLQDWVREEIDEVVSAKGLQYEKVYSSLKRCLALMFETLRIYTPVAHISRATGNNTQRIITPSGTYEIPPRTTIYVSGACIHVSPSVWGVDALEFLPNRWLLDDGSLLQPPRSSFIPWGGGPRTCPGMKMAEVEFVAVIMMTFRTYKVSPVVRLGESAAGAAKRLEAVVADSQPRVTLQMNRPRDVELLWERR